jgi:NADPH-dependent curcumin reductase CurA
MTNQVIVLNKRPSGKPTTNDFKTLTEQAPDARQGEILLRTKFVSVDPYLRGRMNDKKSYVPPFELGKPISSGIVAEVVESKSEAFAKGDFVTGSLEWKEFQTSDGKDLVKVDPQAVPLSAYLGAAGMTGRTAYFGLLKIGRPVKGDTLVVSGAAGAVGSIAGQIGKIMGCRVIGIAGSDEKVNALKNKFGFDEAINYKTTKDMAAAIAAACPDGVDIYFDNVGGEVSDAVFQNLNINSRVAVCGSISGYNTEEENKGPRLQPIINTKRVLMQGFIVSDFDDEAEEANKQLVTWIKHQEIKYAETIVEGFDKIPQAFIDLFEGRNEGKMIVKV